MPSLHLVYRIEAIGQLAPFVPGTLSQELGAACSLRPRDLVSGASAACLLCMQYIELGQHALFVSGTLPCQLRQHASCTRSYLTP